jgi:ubiquinone/menaquinone biosynthesis C-methylase UbiE
MGTFANFGDDKYKILSEMKRVLKDNGNIIISVYSEDALDERLKAYKQANLKLKEIDRQKGRVVIDIIGDAISEQFSERELRNIFAKSSLKVIKVKKVGIAYLCLLSK